MPSYFELLHYYRKCAICMYVCTINAGLIVIMWLMYSCILSGAFLVPNGHDSLTELFIYSRQAASDACCSILSRNEQIAYLNC
jgi:hypothetical protein